MLFKDELDLCFERAKKLNHKYVGLRNGRECYSGDTISGSALDDSNCDKGCKIYPQMTCGTETTNSVWEIPDEMLFREVNMAYSESPAINICHDMVRKVNLLRDKFSSDRKPKYMQKSASKE